MIIIISKSYIATFCVKIYHEFMTNAAFKTDTATEFIDRALSDFLRDKKLKLTNQQHRKLKKLLMVRLMDEEMSYASAYNQLSDIVEYRKDYEIDANARNEAEEEMIRIIGAADVQEVEVPIETTRFKKRFIVVATILVLLLIGLASLAGIQYLQHRTVQMTTVINTTEEEQIKTLVAQVVGLEKTRGNDITAASIYNKIKKLDGVTKNGTATSYKKFNHAQYQAAVEFLEGRVNP